LLPITIIARTLLFILLAVELYRLLTQPAPQSQSERASVPVAPNRN
jgi:hypothetical protein